MGSHPPIYGRCRQRSIKKGADSRVILAGNPVKGEGEFVLEIERLAQQLAVFKQAGGLLVDLADQVEIIVEQMQVLTVEYLSIKFNEFHQGQKRGVLGMQFLTRKRGLETDTGFRDGKTDQLLVVVITRSRLVK